MMTLKIFKVPEKRKMQVLNNVTVNKYILALAV